MYEAIAVKGSNETPEKPLWNEQFPKIEIFLEVSFVTVEESRF
jgi:hypothetical protein